MTKPSTQEKYDEIIDASGAQNGKQLVSWVQRKVHAEQPRGTNFPILAAAKHYLRGLGYTLDELDQLLPKSDGLPDKTGKPLTISQLNAYHIMLEQVPDPSKTLLALLPSTGLKIGEAVALQVSDVLYEDRMYLRAPRRKIPLTNASEQQLVRFIEERKPTTWLFSYRNVQPLTAHAVRKYTRMIAASHPELSDLTPTTLRYTYAALLQGQGASALQLQELLGHESLLTTRRYLTDV